MHLSAYTVTVRGAHKVSTAHTVLAKSRKHACEIATESHKNRAWKAICQAPVSDEVRHEMVERFRRASVLATVEPTDMQVSGGLT